MRRLLIHQFEDVVINLMLFFFHVLIQGVSAKIFEPNISVICQRIFMKFKMQIF
jgi:hypothetical protein